MRWEDFCWWGERGKRVRFLVNAFCIIRCSSSCNSAQNLLGFISTLFVLILRDFSLV